MNWKLIRNTLNERYQETGDARALYVSRRVNRYLKKKNRAERNSRVRNILPENITQFQMFMKAIREDKHILAIDAEWSPWKPITEIGVYDYRAKQCHNIRLTQKGGDGFRHGETVRMNKALAKQWLHDTLNGVDMVIGHAFKNDLRQFAQWGFNFPKVRIVDTALWSKALFPPNEVSLVKLADQYGIDRRGSHCAGNDAHVTLLVALAMAGLR